MSNEELLAIILKTGSKKYNVKEVAARILELVGDINKLKDIGINSLMYSAQFYEDDGTPKKEETDSEKSDKSTYNERITGLI